ncbi:MAG: MBL fold metallo-hydrolase [Nitrospirota bacterium]|jgi:hydroxyacylglutathione hydrolase
MIIRSMPVGPLESNAYVVADREGGSAMVVDPGDEPDRVLELTEGFAVTHIVLTHAHFDHVGAVAEVKEATGAAVALHEAEREVYEAARDQGAFWGYAIPPLPDPDIFLKDGDALKVGSLTMEVLHTPGHSPGSISLKVDGAVLTGDTLFAGSVGRTDFPGGSLEMMASSFRRLMALPDETVVLPGHGPGSTIGQEKTRNVFAREFLS